MSHWRAQLLLDGVRAAQTKPSPLTFRAEPGAESGIRGWSRGSGVLTGKLGGWSTKSSALCSVPMPWYLGRYYLSFTGDGYGGPCQI